MNLLGDVRRPLRFAMGRVLSFGVSRIVSIGVYAGPSPLSLAPPAGVRNPILTPRDVSDVVASLVADPFMVRVDGTWHMFFEVMAWRSGSRKGEIGFATSRDGLQWTYRHIVLAEPFHLSYPYVFQWNSDYYMIPESYRAGAIRLYRAERFPDRWVFVKNLMTGPVFLDSSVFERDGRWWMLTETSPRRANDTLRLFHAPAPIGPWSEHPSSPIVKGDPHVARPAGRVLTTEDRVVRFAQDCRPVYGTSVRAFEIVRLTTGDYEEAAFEGNPLLSGSGRGWNGGGMHHVDPHRLDDGSWLACVDGWRAVRGPRRILDWAREPRRGAR